MLKTFVFVRHGDAIKTKVPGGRSIDKGLTPLGRQQTQDAAEWLLSLGIEPDVIVHTQTPRASETAHILLDTFGEGVQLVKTRSGFRDINGLHTKLKHWTHKAPAKTLLFCGHHSSQQTLAKSIGLQLHRTERGVIVVGLPDWQSKARVV